MDTVLIVDDDTDLMEMVSTLIETHGFNVRHLAEASHFSQVVEEHTPDLILTDVYLGDLDGRDLCYHLKQGQKHQGTPIILYSAGVITPLSIERARADSFMVKPFEIGKLIETIQYLIRKSKTSS